MKVDWAQLKMAVERGLKAANKGERGSMRVHCKACERMLKGAKDERAKEIGLEVHHASVSIDLAKAVAYLEKALSLFDQVESA